MAVLIALVAMFTIGAAAAGQADAIVIVMVAVVVALAMFAIGAAAAGQADTVGVVVRMIVLVIAHGYLPIPQKTSPNYGRLP
jgi:hypothetical protein